MTIDRQKAQEFMAAVKKAVEQIGKDMDLAIRIDGGSYSANGVTVKVAGERIGPDNVPVKVRHDWDWSAPRHGLAKEDLGRTFSFQGTRYTINAWNTRAPKRPVIAVRDSDGRTFCFDPQTVKTALALPAHLRGAA